MVSANKTDWHDVKAIINIRVTFGKFVADSPVDRTTSTFLLLDMDVIQFRDLSTGLLSPSGI